MADYVLNRLAQEALKELTLWAEELDRCDTEAKAVTYDILNETPSKTRERKNRRNDAVCTRVVVRERVDHLAAVRGIAGTLIEQLRQDVQRKRNVKATQCALDAWAMTLRTNDPVQLYLLVRGAANLTARI